MNCFTKKPNINHFWGGRGRGARIREYFFTKTPNLKVMPISKHNPNLNYQKKLLFFGGGGG